MKKIFSVICLCFIVSVAFAESPFKFAILESIKYDDNIYLTEKDKKSSAISSTQLFADYLSQIPNSSLKVGLGANVGYNAYSENPSNNNYINAGAKGFLENEYFKLYDSFIYTSEQATNELTERTDRISNNIALNVRSSREKMFSVGLVASDVFDRYMKCSKVGLNRNRFNIGAQVFYNISPKTSVFVEDVVSSIHYEKNTYNDSTQNSLAVGVEGNITEKIKGTAKVSYDYRDYKKDNTDKANLLGYFVSLTYKPMETNSFTLIGRRAYEETTYINNRYYVSTAANLLANQKLSQKFDVSLLLSYENMDYPIRVGNDFRVDDFYAVKPAVNYKFREYLTAGLWYKFKTKHSNIANDYTDNTVGLDFKFTF